MHTTILSLIPALLLLAACDDKPSASDIEDMLNESFAKEGLGDAIAYDDCEKTNGFDQSANVYSVTLQCQLVFKKSFREIMDSEQKHAFALFDTLENRDMKAGDRKPQQVNTMLMNTDNGWALSQY